MIRIISMSKYPASLLAALAVGIILGRLLAPPPAATASPPAPVENGDTNGDGARDIADAVHLLEWLFLGGPEPAPIAPDCPPRFRDNGDGTVSDSLTGLLWLKATWDVDRDGTIGDGDRLSPSGAMAAAEVLEFAGFADWRLPTEPELFTLIDVTRWNVHIAEPFEAAYGIHWVSSTMGGDPCHGCPLGIEFGGEPYQRTVEGDLPIGYFLAVRGDSWPDW